MKCTGVVRKIDGLGRIVLPKELRDNMGLPSGTPMLIYVDEKEDAIVLREYTEGCVFCGEADRRKLEEYCKVKVCRSCRKVSGSV